MLTQFPVLFPQFTADDLLDGLEDPAPQDVNSNAQQQGTVSVQVKSHYCFLDMAQLAKDVMLTSDLPSYAVLLIFPLDGHCSRKSASGTEHSFPSKSLCSLHSCATNATVENWVSLHQVTYQ